MIEQLESQGLQVPPNLAIGDGALGFWKALAKKAVSAGPDEDQMLIEALPGK